MERGRLQADFDRVEGVFECFAEGAGKLGEVSWQARNVVRGRRLEQKVEGHTEP